MACYRRIKPSGARRFPFLRDLHGIYLNKCGHSRRPRQRPSSRRVGVLLRTVRRLHNTANTLGRNSMKSMSVSPYPPDRHRCPRHRYSLAACGSSKEKVGGSAANNAEDILKNLQVNKQDRSSLKQAAPDSRGYRPGSRTSTCRPRAATPPATWTHWHPATFPP